MFNPTDDKTLLAQCFYDKFIYFFEVLKDLKSDDKNIFKEIKDYNNWECILPYNKELNDVKLSNELIDKIFDKFHFKNLTKKSSKKEIIKNMFNTYFNKKIVLTRKLDDNNHYENYISDDVRLLFHYGMQNLKCESKKTVKYNLELLDFDDEDDVIDTNNELNASLLENTIMSNVKSTFDWYENDHIQSKKSIPKNNSV